MAGLIIFAIFALVIGLMYLGWRNRKKRQNGLADPLPAPPESQLGRLEGTFEGQYVATTTAGDPFDRIAVRGLGFRAKAFVVVAEKGIVVHIAGSAPPFIPASSIRELRTASWTIDRGVEHGGLHLVGWTLGGTEVDSYLRMNEPKAFENAVNRVLSITQERHTS